MKCHLDSGGPIGNFPYDFEGLELAEIFAKGRPEGWKIICHDNSNRCYWAGSWHKYQPYSVLKTSSFFGFESLLSVQNETYAGLPTFVYYE